MRPIINELEYSEETEEAFSYYYGDSYDIDNETTDEQDYLFGNCSSNINKCME